MLLAALGLVLAITLLYTSIVYATPVPLADTLFGPYNSPQSNSNSNTLRKIKDDDNFCFISLGCWGGMPPVKQAQRDVAEVIAKLITAGVQDPLRRDEQIRFIVAAGDNFYMDGVKDVYDERFFTTFEGIYTEKEVRNVPWLVALGNHDHRGNWSAQVKYTYAVGDRDNYEDRWLHLTSNVTAAVTGRWYMPHPYYAIKVSDDMVVVVIDTVLLHRCHEQSRECWDGGKQKRVVEEWLLSTYASVRHKVVVGHFPAFSNGPHKNFPWFQSWLVPLMAKSCASIYIHADNHYLQLSKHGFQYYANSGGGGGLRLHSPRKLESWTQKESIFHAVEFGIMLHCKKGNRLTHRILNRAGDELFKFVSWESSDGDAPLEQCLSQLASENIVPIVTAEKHLSLLWFSRLLLLSLVVFFYVFLFLRRRSRMRGRRRL